MIKMKTLFLLILFSCIAFSQNVYLFQKNGAPNIKVPLSYISGDSLNIPSGGQGTPLDTNALHYTKLAAKQNLISNLSDTSKYLEGKDTVSLSNRINAISGGSGFTYVKRTADTSNSATTLVNLGGMNFPVVAGTNYYFKFTLTYSSAALTTGLRTALTVPAFTNFSAFATHYGQAVDGVSGAWHGTINTSGDAVVSTAVAVINVNYEAVIEGRILPSANGTVWLQIGSEVTSSAVTIRNGSFLMWQSY